MGMIRVKSVDELGGVVDDAHGGDGIKPQMRAHQQRLRIAVRNTADGAAAVEAVYVGLEFRAEGCGFDVVDLPLEGAAIAHGHAAPAGAQMGVVIHPEENVKTDVAVGDRAEKPAHYAKNSSERVMGSMYFPSL